MSKDKRGIFWTLGPFSFTRHKVTRGDGAWWTAYQFAYKEHTFMAAGPDRFVIRFETKMRDA